MKLIIELFPDQERELTAIVERGPLAGHGPVSTLVSAIAVASNLGLAHERRFRALLEAPPTSRLSPIGDVWTRIEELAKQNVVTPEGENTNAPSST